MKFIRLFLLMSVVMLLLIGCDEESKKDVPRRAHLTSTDIEFDSDMKEKLLDLANRRGEWFLASDITTEALEGLYGSWSVVCRSETSLSEYKGAVYEVIRPLVLESLDMKLTDAQKAERYYNVDSWSSPWAYVQETWKIGGKIILGPQLGLYLVESGEWRYHDC